MQRCSCQTRGDVTVIGVLIMHCQKMMSVARALFGSCIKMNRKFLAANALGTTVSPITMSSEKFKPLELDSSTGEPFLRLPAPHDNIIITPPRLEDGPETVQILNDPKVYKYLSGPPFPYLQENADEWQALIKSQSDPLIEDISSKEVGAIVSGCPVRAIREVRADGSELYIGDVSVTRHGWLELDDEKERTALREENLARDVGDPNILWAFGGMCCFMSHAAWLSTILDYIRPSHQGRGIMSIAVGALMKEWLVPRMNVRRVHASMFEGNRGSFRVFEKNGFVFIKTIKTVREGPGFGRIEGIHVMEWKFEDQ